jgi:DnaJ-class molecular chaperone
MSDFRSRKKERVDYFDRYVYAWKERECIACSGSGRYDHNGSPKCSACNGTGKETYNANLIKEST